MFGSVKINLAVKFCVKGSKYCASVFSISHIYIYIKAKIQFNIATFTSTVNLVTKIYSFIKLVPRYVKINQYDLFIHIY